MSNTLLKKTPLLKKTIFLLSFLATFPAHSASVDVDKSTHEPFNINEEFSNLELQKTQKKQAVKRLKENYLTVLNLVKSKQFKEAKTKVASLLQQSPNQSVYYNLNALLQLIDKDIEGARQSFLKAIELNDKNTQAYIGLSKLALDAKQFDLAREYADKTLAINPYEVKVYQILADIEMQLQGKEAVEELLLNAREKVKTNAASELFILKLLNKLFVNTQQPEKILPLAASFLEKDKDNIAALAFFAEAQVTNKDFTGAETTLRKMIAKQPDNAKYLFLLAKLLEQQKGHEKESLDLLDKASQKVDNPALILSYKAAILLKLKQFEKAHAVANKVDQANSEYSIGKLLKGDIYLAEKNYPEALKNYQQAYALTPNLKVLDTILKILTVQKQQNQVVTLLEKELAKDKDNKAIQFRLAVAYQQAGKMDLSKKYYEDLLNIQKDNIIILNNLAEIYRLENNPKALDVAERAYKIAPNSGAISDTYGYILLKQGNVNKSLELLKQAAKLNPKLDEIQLHLAEAYIANNNKAQAKEILQQLIDAKSEKKSQAEKLINTI